MINTFMIYEASLHHFNNKVEQTRNAVHHNVLCSRHLVGPFNP